MSALFPYDEILFSDVIREQNTTGAHRGKMNHYHRDMELIAKKILDIAYNTEKE